MTRTFQTSSEQETFQLGRRLAAELEPPVQILLIGGMGSGKTVLARGLAAGFGVPDPDLVHSPTFTLVNEYPSPLGTVYHIDLYRLETLRDLYSIGIEEILASGGVVMIEWADKLRLEVDQPVRIELAAGDSPDIRIVRC